MAEIVTDCPRCGAKRITFEVLATHVVNIQYGWQQWYEAFSICRHCYRSTTLVLSESVNSNYKKTHEVGLLNLQGSLNNFVDVERYVSLRDMSTFSPPEHVPPDIEMAFKEGATCFSVGCYNAVGAMLRLCLDLARSRSFQLRTSMG
jgi:hypothetical protein